MNISLLPLDGHTSHKDTNAVLLGRGYTIPNAKTDYNLNGYPNLSLKQYFNASTEVALTESAPVDHVEDTSGCSDDDLAALVQLVDVLADVGASDAGVALSIHVVAQGNHHLLDLEKKQILGFSNL
jgi:hypothetical protein